MPAQRSSRHTLPDGRATRSRISVLFLSRHPPAGCSRRLRNGEDEQVMGLYTMIADNLATPFQTEVLGVEVTVGDIRPDRAQYDRRSLFSRGVRADDQPPRPSPADATT
jgi:hypothetical protein